MYASNDTSSVNWRASSTSLISFSSDDGGLPCLTDRKFDSRRALCWVPGRGGWWEGFGLLCQSYSPTGTSDSLVSRVHKSQRPFLSRSEANMIPDPASVKAETRREASDSSFPGRFGLVGLLTVSEFEKARIDLVGGVAIRLASRLNCPAGAGFTLRYDRPPAVRRTF